MSTQIGELIQGFTVAVVGEIRKAVDDALVGVVGEIVEKRATKSARDAAAFADIQPNDEMRGFLERAPRPRKPSKPQLCPVPGCKNRAAPVFGMVCAKHKGTPKAKIKQYRDARRKAIAAKKGKR